MFKLDLLSPALRSAAFMLIPVTLACATSIPTPDLTSGDDAGSEASAPSSDGGIKSDGIDGSDGAPAKACGQLLPGPYDFTVEFVSGTSGCSRSAQTGSTTYTSFPEDLQTIGDALGNCKRVDAADGCPATLSCSGGNGRLAMTQDFTFSIPTTGPATQFSYTLHSTSRDTLGTYADSDCTYRTTFVAKK